MQEARRILVDPHSCLQKHRIIGPGQLEHHLLVRNARGHDPHIHAPFRRQTQGGLHLVIHDQVGRKNIDVIPRLVQNIQVDVLRHDLVVQGGVPVGLHEALALKGLRVPDLGTVRIIGTVRAALGIPHPQEHHRIIPDGLALQHKACILPVAETDLFINIFVRQIDAAAESRMPVDDRDFPVIPVVHDQGPEGNEAVEGDAFDSRLLKLLVIVRREQGDASQVVVHKTHVQSGLRLFDEDFPDASPHLSFTHDEEFHKNKMLRLFQFLQKIPVQLLSYLIIAGRRPPVYRVSACHGGVAHLSLDPAVQGPDLLHHVRILQKLVFRADALPLHLPAHVPGRPLVAHSQVKQAAQDRQGHNQNNPCHLIGRVVVPVDDPEHSQQAYYGKDNGNHGRIAGKPGHEDDKPDQLHSKNQTKRHQAVLQHFL